MIVRSLIASLTLVSSAAPALAAEEEVAAISIRVSDLDLSSSAGRVQFEGRAKSAARDACSTGDLGIHARLEEQRCIERIVAEAKAQID